MKKRKIIARYLMIFILIIILNPNTAHGIETVFKVAQENEKDMVQVEWN